MSAQTIEIPFVRGIQAAGDRDAVTEMGKLVRAYNLHIRPEAADVFSLRPGAAYTALSLAEGTNAKLGRIPAEDRLVISDTESVYIENDAGAFITDNIPRPIVSETTCEGIELQAFPDSFLHMMGYAVAADGTEAVVYSVEDPDLNPTVLVFQLRVLGVWQTPTTIKNSSFEVTKCWVMATTDRWAIYYQDSATEYACAVSTSLTTAPTVTVLRTGVIYDAAGYGGTGHCALSLNASNRLQVTHHSPTTAVATSTTAVTAAGPVSPVYGVLAVNSTGTAAVYHGDYVADSNTLYLHIVTTSTSTARGSVATALGTGISVNGATCSPLQDTQQRTFGITVAASYCYLVGASATSGARIGRLFYVEGTTANVSGTNANYVGPFIPQGRLWTSTKFYGARIFGRHGLEFGCWQVDTGGHPVLGNNQPRTAVVYHSVNLADNVNEVHRTGGIFNVACTQSTYQTTDSYKGLLYRLDCYHLKLVTLAQHDTTGDIVAHGGFPLRLSGQPRYFDGRTFVPAGFPQPPKLTVTVSAAGGNFGAGGGNDALGVYVYGAVWEWHDANGRKQQSATELHTVTLSVVNSRVDLRVRPDSIPMDERLGSQFGANGQLTLVAYRSEVNEQTLKRCAGAIVSVLTAPVRLQGNTNNENILFAGDDGAGVFPPTNEPLYMFGGDGELEDTALEALLFVRGYSDRFVYVTAQNPTFLQYTKTQKEGRSIEPNQRLLFKMPQSATGLAAQDGNVYWFTRDNVWSVTPQFADDAGQNEGTIDPVPLSFGIGCTQPGSIIEHATGVYFASTRGIYLLPRGGGPPAFIGAEVEPYFSDFPVCKSCAHRPQSHELAWALRDTADTDHILLVYNYQTQQWFTWRLGVLSDQPEYGLRGGIANKATGFVALQQEIGATVAGIARCSDAAVIDDSSIDTTISPVIESADIFAGQIGQQTRFLDLAVRCRNGAVLTVEESTDSGATFVNGQPFLLSSGAPIYQFLTQKADQMRFRLTRPSFSQPTPTHFAGVSLRVSRQGRAFTPAAARKG